MNRYLFLSILLAALSATSGADSQPRSAENEVSWTDTFKEGELKGYALVGKLTRDKRGGVILGEKSILIRELALGFEAEAEADIAFPESLGPNRGLLLTLRGGYDINFTLVSLRLEKGKPVLEVREAPITPYSLDAPGVDPEGPWTLKVRVRHGVVQAKAWPKGKPEPTDWQVTRYSESSEWEPRVFSILPDTGQAAHVTRLAVRGKKPATNLYLKSDEPGEAEKKQLVKLSKQMNAILAKGNLAGALEQARANVETSRKAFGTAHAFTATCINNLAAVLLAAGNHADALKMFEEALELRRKVLPADHPQLALSIEGIGAALVAAGKPAEGEKKYRDALALRRRVLGDEHPDTAVSWNNLGEALSLQAEHREALKCLRESLRIRTTFYGDAHVDVARIRNNLGYQLFMMGEYRDARMQYDAAMKVYKTVHGPAHATHPDTAKLENNLGVLLKAMGQFKEAQTHFDTALAIFTKVGGPKARSRGTVLGHMGVLAAEGGDYVAARALLEEALTIAKAALGEDHYETAITELNLALVLNALNDPEATRLVKVAFKKVTAVLPADHPTVAQALQNLVWLTADLTEASQLVRKPLEQALAIKRERLGAHHPETIVTLNGLAQHITATGEWKEAEKLLVDALAVCRDKLGDGHTLTCLVRHNLGAVYFAQGEYAKATGHFKQALEGFTKAFGREHPQTAQTLNLLAFSLIAQDERAEGLTLAAEAAAGYATVARKLLAGTSENQHAAVIEKWRPEVHLFLSLAATNPGLFGRHGPALLGTVMDWKATSGRALLDRLEALTVGQVPEAGERYRELQDHRRALIRGIMHGAGSEGVENYNAALGQLRERVETLERDLAKQVKGYAAVTQAREAGPGEVANRIPASGVLIEFVRVDEIKAKREVLKGISGEASYVALVVIPKAGGGEPNVTIVPLGAAKEVDKAIESWRDLARSRKRDPVIEGELREKVWDPLAKVVPTGTKRLILAPAGQLALIPFEAIWSDDAFLVEKYLISYCSTGRDLIPRPAPQGEPGPSAVVADPDFDHVPVGVPAPQGTRPGGVSGLAYRSEPPKEDRLPGFSTEADAVTKLLTDKFAIAPKSFRRVDATEENVQSLTRPRVLYFITHGNFLTDQKTLVTLEGRLTGFAQGPGPSESPFLGVTFGEDPRLRSYLCLTGSNKWKERATRKLSDGTPLSDGLLTAREVETLDLWGTDLVVTAACKTGEGHVQVGEGVMGLRRAFQQAGARTVVTSLWSVSDDKTTVLLPRFLGHYLAGTSKAEALRKAQLEMIAELRAAEPKKKREYQAAPFSWAAFVCHGLPE